MDMKEVDFIDLITKVEKLRELLAGDDFGNEGVLVRLRRNEERDGEILGTLKELKTGQQKQMDFNAAVDKRLKSMESFFVVFRALSNPSQRRGIAVVIVVFSAIGYVITQLENVVAFFKGL